MNLRIEKYNASKHRDLWDDFVMNHSVNGTIFHTQKFLSYHPEGKFEDCSILIYDDKKLAAVMLAAQTSDGFFSSHPGTSGGGVVIEDKLYKSDKIDAIIDKIFNYFKNRIKMRVFESCFSEANNDALVYFISKKTALKGELSIYLKTPPIKNTDIVSTITDSRTRTAVRKLQREGYGFEISNRKKDYEQFYKILTDNLGKHKVKPVHTLKDFLKLREILVNDQFLALGKDKIGNIVSGLWVVKANRRAWHTQYIARDISSNLQATLEHTIVNALKVASNENVKVLSLGVCTENEGDYLNKGLISFKEKLGGFHQLRYIAAIS